MTMLCLYLAKFSVPLIWEPMCSSDCRSRSPSYTMKRITRREAGRGSKKLSGGVTTRIVKSTAEIDDNNQLQRARAEENGTLCRAMRIGGACTWTGSQLEIDPGLRESHNGLVRCDEGAATVVWERYRPLVASACVGERGRREVEGREEQW